MIVFLDFDGVLHPFSRPDGPFTLLPQFERVMRDFPDVEIVISSAWREAYGLAQLKAIFSRDIAERIIGATPVFAPAGYRHVREAEIQSWLLDNDREHERWVAIDDTNFFFAPRCTNLILVDSELGFAPSTEQALRKRLRG
jgi:hypothetical protein